MTIPEAKHLVVSLAQQEVGYHEGENNWNKYAQELDSLNITWGKKQNMAWCGEFIIWLFYKCFGVSKALAMMYSGNPTSIPVCGNAAQYFKSAGQWFKTPELGDIVFFNVGGIIGHTGIVIRVDGNTFFTVEGNCKDAVSACKYTVGDSYVAGFGRPKWSLMSDDQTPAPKVDLPEVKRGCKGELVRAAQFLLNGRGASCGKWGADADFGPATESAVYAYQRRNDIDATGVVNQETWAKLLGMG